MNTPTPANMEQAVGATRLLYVEGPHFTAGAIWAKEGVIWRCFHAAPILRWMVGKTGDEVKHLRGKPGWRLEWA